MRIEKWNTIPEQFRCDECTSNEEENIKFKNIQCSEPNHTKHINSNSTNNSNNNIMLTLILLFILNNNNCI